MRSVLLMLFLMLVAFAGVAQDAVEVDPDHYEVAFENEHVRVLLINYDPGETSVMHYHPAGVSVFLTDIEVEFELPDGTKQVVEAKGRENAWIPAGHHLPTNIGDEPFTVYHIEIKGIDGGE